MKRIPRPTSEKISQLAQELRELADAGREYEEEQPEAWGVSSKGEDYCCWLDEIEGVVDALESLSDIPGGEMI
jgi:hypothetical protein